MNGTAWLLLLVLLAGLPFLGRSMTPRSRISQCWGVRPPTVLRDDELIASGTGVLAWALFLAASLVGSESLAWFLRGFAAGTALLALVLGIVAVRRSIREARVRRAQEARLGLLESV